MPRKTFRIKDLKYPDVTQAAKELLEQANQVKGIQREDFVEVNLTLELQMKEGVNVIARRLIHVADPDLN